MQRGARLWTGGDEVIYSILDVMYAQAPSYTTIRRGMNIHPTVSELIPTMLGKLQPLDRAVSKSAIRTERS